MGRLGTLRDEGGTAACRRHRAAECLEATYPKSGPYFNA